MEQHVFAFSLIIEGTTEKALQFIMPLMTIYKQNFGSVEQKMYLWTLQRVSNNKKSINWYYLGHENIFLMTFSELPPIGL
jgi:hypothetical protein